MRVLIRSGRVAATLTQTAPPRELPIRWTGVCLVLDERDDRLGQGGDRVAAVRAGRRVAEPGQVHRLAGEPVPEQVDQVGPVAARTLQAVHAERGLGVVRGLRSWCAAHEDLVVAEANQPAGPVRDRLGHALALRRGLALVPDLEPGLSSFPSSCLVGLAAAALGRRHAGPQDLGQVGGLLLGLGQVQAGRPDDVVALDLGLDHGLERLAVRVVVLIGLEVLGHRVDERGGHLQLLRPDLDVLVQEGEVGLAHLVGPQQGLQRDDPLPDPQRGQRLALAQRHLGHGHLARRLQGVAEQRVRPDARLLGLGVVALVRVDGLDLGGRREVQHLDPVRGHQRQVGQVLVGQHHHVAGGQFVALGDVGVRDFLPVERADPAELDPGPVLAVHLAEGDVTLLRRGVELHRDHDQAERDRTGPYAAHGLHLPRLASR